MATKHYKYACPERPGYLIDGFRPSVGWIMRNAAREDYVRGCCAWTIEELEEHQSLRDKQTNNPYSRCAQNLKKGIELKKSGNDDESMEYLIAHFYENLDMS